MGAPAQGREGAGKMAGEERNREASRLRKSHPPHPPATQNPITAESIPGTKSHWTGGRLRGLGVGPSSGAEHNTLGFSCVSHLLLVCGVGAGVGRGERYLDFGLFPIRNQQFCS